MPASLGQKTGANSFPVILASDQTVSVGTSFKYLNSPAIGMTAITYQAGDVIGGLVTVSSVTNTKAYRLDNVTLRARDPDTTKNYLLVFFSSNPSASSFSDGDVMSINTVDKTSVAAIIPVASSEFQATGAGGTYFAVACPEQSKTLGSTGSVYLLVVAAEEVVGVANSLELSLGVTQDG
jgi:hypothetical protein